MQSVVVAIPTHRGFPHESTKEAVRQLARLGAEIRIASQISDIAGGRSWLLTEALETAEAQNRDVVLCIDDDMSFTSAQAQAVVDAARQTGIATSACYATSDGHFAGCRHTHGRYLVGLGFLAIPTRLLRYVASTLPYVRFNGKRRVYAFSESRARVELDEWCAEDYDVCRKLGGVHVLPIAVGHLKMIPLVPNQEDVLRFTTWPQEESPAEDGPPTERG